VPTVPFEKAFKGYAICFPLKMYEVVMNSNNNLKQKIKIVNIAYSASKTVVIFLTINARGALTKFKKPY
jgi:hypothetical protein